MSDRTPKQQREYLKTHPIIYQKQLQKQKEQYKQRKIRDLFIWLS